MTIVEKENKNKLYKLYVLKEWEILINSNQSFLS